MLNPFAKRAGLRKSKWFALTMNGDKALGADFPLKDGTPSSIGISDGMVAIYGLTYNERNEPIRKANRVIINATVENLGGLFSKEDASEIFKMYCRLKKSNK